MDEEKIIQQFILNMKVGLPGIESKKDGYNAKNPDSSATGKYQFLKEWLTKKGPVKGIKEFAQGLYGNIETMEDFKNNPQLQEDYFEYYAKNVLYPQAKKSVSGTNPLQLSLEEAGALYHFQAPDKAKEAIKTGVLPSKTNTNVSANKYLEVFNKTLEGSGVSSTPHTTFYDDKSKKQIVDYFNKKNADIDAMEINDGSKEKLRRNLYQEMVDNGNTDIINEHIKKENNDNLNEWNKARNLELVLDGATKSQFERTNAISIITDDDSKGDIQKAIKDYPELFKHHQMTDKGKRLYISQYNSREFAKKIFDMNVKGEINLGTDQTTGNTLWGFFSNLIPDAFKSGAIADSKTTYVARSIDKPKERPLIDETNFKKKSRTEQWENEEVTKPKSETKPDEKKIEKPSDSNLAEDFFRNELALNSMNQDNFNYEPGKREVPVDAIMGMALGLIGNAQAKKAKIPLRTEEVSNAFKNYTAELAAKSKEGLPVEIEAAMKNDLADAYQGGLANIVNASAGNRATILGNLGSLEQAKNKGLVGIRVADFEAKDRAFAQYGQALQYANEFDARRDIANHGIKYTEAMRQKLKGEALATAGFTKLIEALKYERENGPGSVNDQYRSLLMQKMFGFDPKMPDDGKGTTPGTQSFYETRKALTRQNYDDTVLLYDQYGKLNPKQKSAVSQFVSQNQDKEKIKGFMNYLSQNPEMDPSKLKMDNIDLALKKNDFSVLGKTRPDALQKTNEPGLTYLSEEDLQSEGGTLEPQQQLGLAGKNNQGIETQEPYEDLPLLNYINL